MRSFLSRRWPIRIFGVSLLAVAAVATAVLWKRRREELEAWFEPEEETDYRLENLRVAGL